MYINYTSRPLNKLKRAKGLPDAEFKLGSSSVESLLSRYSSISTFWKEAIKNPGTTLKRYHEENSYEYEDRVTYNAETNTITANTYSCPYSYNHHIGSTCGCCGQKD